MKGLIWQAVATAGVSLFCSFSSSATQFIHEVTLSTHTFNIDYERAFTRWQEPVILRGADLLEFNNGPVDELFLYSWNGQNWIQIPYQIDEITPEGSYFGEDDGLLDENDEIVFMAEDLGDSAAPENWLADCSSFRYEVKVTDPLNQEERGWVYIYCSATLTQDTTDYVSYSPDKIVTNCYIMDHAEDKPHVTSTILVTPGGGGDSTDLIDRMKIRILIDLPWPFPDTTLTEDDLIGYLEGIKDGRVRAVRQLGSIFLGDTSSNARSFYYKSYMLTSSISDTASEPSRQIEIVNFRSTTDFNHELAGLVHYDNSGSSGNGPIYIDGAADSVETIPLGTWWEVDHPSSGCIVAVSDSIPIPGSISMFYQDGDSDPSGRETGENGIWGETGVFVEAPGETSDVEISGCTYILPAAQGNVGELYAHRFQNPLVSESVLQSRLITFIRGDADGSGSLSLSDGIRCLRCQFVPGWPDSCKCDDATDADDNGMVSIGDCLRILRKQFVPGWQDSIPPPCCTAPEDCGSDPTDDDLGCEEHPCMGTR